MDTQYAYLWVGIQMVGPNDIVGHANRAWRGTDSGCGGELGHDVHTK